MNSDGGKVEEIKVNPSLATSSYEGAVAGAEGTGIEMETETETETEMETEIAHRDKQECSDSSISKNENDDISGERQTGQLTQPVTDPIDDDKSYANANAHAHAHAHANVSTQISNPVTDVGSTNNPTKPPHEQEAQETQEAKQERVLPNKEKYKILLVGVGSAPMLKKSKFLLPGKEPFLTLHSRLKKMLKIPPSSHLYLYVNQAFIPSHEDLIGDLGDLFSVGDELQIHYSLQEAFS